MDHYQELSTTVEKRMNMDDDETINVNNSCELIKPVDTVSILVVDDDTTCLSIVAAMLKKFHYEVATVKHPIDALRTLRLKAGAFDLVISDVHMPDMNGFELQQAIAQEFNLPVVLMSADDQEDVVLRGLECGAVFFILKPIFPDDLRDLWQFASMKKKNRLVNEEILNFPEEQSIDNFDFSTSSLNEDMCDKRESKRKSPSNEEADEKRGESSKSGKLKKPKLVWTNTLHNRFLEALRSIGLDEAVPKKILEVMNVPDLTRENVASHLQKYRIFLRRVSEASLRIQNSSHNSTSSFTSSLTPISATRLKIARLYKFNRLEKLFPGASAASLLNQGTSSNTLVAQSKFGQSRFLSNREYLQKPNSETASLINQVDHRAFPRFVQNSYENSTPLQFQGNLSKGSLENLSRGLSDNLDAGNSTSASNRLMSWLSSTSDEVSSHKNDGNTSNTCQSEYKYVGYNLADIQKFIASGKDKNVNSPTLNDAPTSTKDNTANVDPLAQNWGASSSSLSSTFAYDDMNTGGDESLSDVIAEYCRTLEPSNLQYFLGNVENGGENHESNSSDPMFGLAEIFKPTQQLLEECDLNAAVADQVNVQNQPQQMGGENIVTSSGFCVDGTSHWDNRVPSFDQALTQSEDDDFLESLLASSPLAKDHTLEGI